MFEGLDPGDELAARQGEIEGLRRALTLPGADGPGLRAKIRAEKDCCKALRKEVRTGVHVRILHLLASSFGISAFSYFSLSIQPLKGGSDNEIASAAASMVQAPPQTPSP